MKLRGLLVCISLVGCGISPHEKAHGILESGLHDASVTLRVRAAKGLAMTGDTLAVHILFQIAQGEGTDARTAALNSLRDVRPITCTPALVALAQDVDPLVRAEAYELIAMCGEEQCRLLLMTGIADSVARIRRTAYRGLGTFKEKSVLMSGLRDIDPLTRIAAAQALATCGEKNCDALILQELETNNPEILKQAIVALATVGNTSALAVLKKYLAAGALDVRLAASDALLILDDKSGIPVIEQALGSGDPFVRSQAVEILKRHRLPEGSALLALAAQDEYATVSIKALEAIGEYHGREHQQLLLRMMNAPHPLVRIAAATAFLQIER